jgi:hypothetical protein
MLIEAIPIADDYVHSFADVVDNLSREFEPRLPRQLVIAMARHCRRELDIDDSAHSLADLQRLAARRLAELPHR